MNDKTETDELLAILREEEFALVASQVAGRVDAIASMPDGRVRTLLHAHAHLTAGQQLLTGLEGRRETARQFRRMADAMDAISDREL